MYVVFAFFVGMGIGILTTWFYFIKRLERERDEALLRQEGALKLLTDKIESLQEFTKALNEEERKLSDERTEKLKEVLDNTSRALISNVTSNFSQVSKNFNEAFSRSLERFSGEFQRLFSTIDKLLADNRSSLKEFSEANLEKVNETGKLIREQLDHMSRMVEEMNRVFSDFTRFVSGTKRRGKSGENMLADVLRPAIEAGLVVRNFKVGSKEVEFAWKVTESRFIPIDVKFFEVELSRLEGADNDSKEFARVLSEVKKKLKNEIENVRKYANQPNTTKEVILVVPSYILDLVPEVIASARNIGVLVCSYREVVLIAATVAQYERAIEELGDVGVYKEVADNYRKALEEIIEMVQRFSRIAKQIENAADKIFKRAEGALRFDRVSNKALTTDIGIKQGGLFNDPNSENSESP